MIRARCTAAFAGMLVTLLVASTPAGAYQINDNAEVYGFAQVYATAWEEMGQTKGAYQFPSHDEGTDVASGFTIAMARVGARLSVPDWNLSVHTQVQLDHSLMLLDADVAWTPRRWFSLHVGQFKVPGTYEALTDDRELDFILRSNVTTALADYGLSRSENYRSVLYGSVSILRDLGVAVKGEVGDPQWTGRYFFMVGNGLGAGMYFGGTTKTEYFITNKAQFYYGSRLELAWHELATLGAFGSYNRHDNVIFNSGRAVYDINRRMVGGDLRIVIPKTGLRFGVLAGGGQIRDDFTGDGKIDLRYSGWAASAVWNLFPLLSRVSGRTLPDRHAFELAVRFDQYKAEADQSGLTSRQDNWTFGINYVATRLVKVQLEYILRHTDDRTIVDSNYANNALVANLQAAF